MEKLLNGLIIAAGITAGLFLLPFLLKIFAPFALAFLVAMPCQKIVGALESKAHISRGISSAIISTAIVAAATALILLIAFQLYSQSKNLISALPAAVDSFRGQLMRLTESFNGYKHSLPDELSSLLDSAALSFKDYSGEISRSAASITLNAAGGIASALPGTLLFLTMFILGTFFFTKDYILIINFFNELFPKKVIGLLKKGKSFLRRAFSSYIKAQLLLMLLTSALVTVCLWIVGKDYPLFWGIICGLVDALPFFGTAAVLVPWAIISIIYGDTYSAVAILVIQVIVFLVRQLAEPKIVSRQIGIHPILTLVSVYIGLRFFGVAGMIFAPVIMLLFVNLYVSYKERADG